MMSKSYLLSFAKAKGSIAAVALAAVLMAANATVASAQNKATEDNGIEGTVIGGVDDLSGVDPSETYCTSNGTAETEGDKIVYLYNVGAKKFLSVGGLWGTHASLNVSPYSIYMKWNKLSQTYSLESKVNGSKTGSYLGIEANGVYMDRKNASSVVTFEKAKEYSKTNKVYLVRIGKTTLGYLTTYLGYLTAYPDNENKLCDYQASIATGTQEYKNQEWKVITKNDYHKLFNIAPANMKSVVDASFLIACPDFRVNDTDAANWKIGGVNPTTDVKSRVRFGDEKTYKTHPGNSDWTPAYDETHQTNYGKYYYCYTKGLRGFNIYQDVKVHKAGWYLLRCNGFSTANSSENIKQNGGPLANLFITELGADNKPNDNKYSTATLNGISQADAYQLAQTHNGKNYDGAGIGHAFFEGEYENQVQICLDKAPNGKEITSDNPVTLRIGFYVDPTPDGKPEVAEDELTAVDEFKLLYAGPRRNPELILDEESTDLRYLTKATDEYKNSVLHLNRKLNDNMWNSLILPVDLTWGQMKRTFGDAVKVAKLAALTENSVQFVTVEPKNDDDVMVTAFEPYIVFPPYTQVKSAPYTVEHFYTSEGEDNSEWLGKDYKPSKDENNRLTKTLKADHYDITMVSLDRDKLNEYVNTTNWVSKTQFDATGGGHGTMVCKGTMAKTYDNGKIIEGRDDLNGDYFMYKGKLIQVPHNENGKQYSYGLKAFRCWFELTPNTPAQGKPSQVSLLIDGVEDSTTGIDDIHGSTDCTSYKRGIEGVFNINGQMVRRSCSLEGLPKGMYIVNGKKIIIR